MRGKGSQQAWLDAYNIVLIEPQTQCSQLSGESAYEWLTVHTEYQSGIRESILTSGNIAHFTFNTVLNNKNQDFIACKSF